MAPAKPPYDDDERPAPPLEGPPTEEIPLHLLLSQFVAETQARQQSDPYVRAFDPKLHPAPDGPGPTEPWQPPAVAPRSTTEPLAQRPPGPPAPRAPEPMAAPAADLSQLEGDDGELDIEATSPGMPAAQAGAAAASEKRGDIEQLLAAVGPFLWSLEEAQKWVRSHGAGDPQAEAHARALGLLARILGQLQARLDEVASGKAR